MINEVYTLQEEENFQLPMEKENSLCKNHVEIWELKIPLLTSRIWTLANVKKDTKNNHS